MLRALLLAATVAASESAAVHGEVATPAIAVPVNPPSGVVYSLRLGPTFGGVYYPPYGGQDPYGEGARVDLAVQSGTGKFRFHGLLTASWSPFMMTAQGHALPLSGELAFFAGAGFREDTQAKGPTAFVLEFDAMIGASQMSESFSNFDGTIGFSRFATFYPLDLHFALGVRFARDCELLLSGDLAGGAVWQESKVFAVAIRESNALLLGRSF